MESAHIQAFSSSSVSLPFLNQRGLLRNDLILLNLTRIVEREYLTTFGNYSEALTHQRAEYEIIDIHPSGYSPYPHLVSLSFLLLNVFV